MPLPKGTRYRFRTLSPTRKQRLAFSNGKVIEVESFYRKNGVFVRRHSRRIR